MKLRTAGDSNSALRNFVGASFRPESPSVRWSPLEQSDQPLLRKIINRLSSVQVVAEAVRRNDTPPYPLSKSLMTLITASTLALAPRFAASGALSMNVQCKVMGARAAPKGPRPR